MKATTPSMSLSDRQRKHTRTLHKISDAAVAWKMVVILNSSEELYGRALSSFYPIVCAVEDSIAKQKDHPHIKSASKLLDTVTRRQAMESDLQHYLGVDWRSKVHNSPALKKYIQIISNAEIDQPLALLAFFYTNYVAFCSGGNIIRSRVRKILSPPEGVGTKFFEFEGGAGGAKQTLKTWFNSLQDVLSEEAQQRLIIQCGDVFVLNNEVINSFPIGLGPSIQAGVRIVQSPTVAMVLMVLGALVVALVAAAMLAK